jgi:hypothetical protein
MMRTTSTLLVFLLAVALVSVVQATEGFRGDDSAVVRDLSFFRHFGQTRRNRRELLECDYDHPEKSGHCPPVHRIQPFAEKGEVEGEAKGQSRILAAPQLVVAEQQSE